MADMDPADGPPSFENPFSGQDAERRVYGTVLRTREPTTASGIADRADCDPKTARKYLRWFADLGIVTRNDGEPTTYERNDAYFEWRRIDRLAADNTTEELRRRVSELSERIAEYEDRYAATTPADVDAVAVASSSDDRSIDDVYADLGDWTSALEERERHERARRQRAGTRDRERVSG